MRFFTRNCYASKGVTCTMQGRFLLRETGQAHHRDALETKLRNKGGNRSERNMSKIGFETRFYQPRQTWPQLRSAQSFSSSGKRTASGCQTNQARRL